MKEILPPTIDYARNGHPVHQYIQYLWELNVKRLAEFPGFTEQMTIDGRAPQVGERWINPNLANTLERIANEGRDVFYKGDIARIIGEYMQANGGFLTYEDMAAHESSWVAPVSVNYRGYDVWELPPNGQGIAALQILNILERHDIAAMGFGSADYIHPPAAPPSCSMRAPTSRSSTTFSLPTPAPGAVVASTSPARSASTCRAARSRTIR